MKKNVNVFTGPNALKDFFNPDNHPPIPLVELPPSCNPFRKDGVRIFAKMMQMVPLANVKSLPAFNMLLEAEMGGRLENISSLVESSSGNTVFSLAVLAQVFGIKKTRAIVSHEVSEEKLNLLRFFGTSVSITKDPICPDPNDTNSGIYKAKRLGRKKGWMNPGQYDNEANPRAHEKWTGPQIWKQTNEKISIFCAGLGTTGTLAGAGSFLKKKNKNISVLGVVRAPNNPVPGVRTRNLLREIAFDWEYVVDEVVEIGTHESFETSLKLCRLGLLAGPSSGFALAGLVHYLKAQRKNCFKKCRNTDGEVIAVFICPDSPFPYLNEYFKRLDKSLFPETENSELLLEKKKQEKEGAILMNNYPLSYEMHPLLSYQKIYKDSIMLAWKKLENNKQITFQNKTEIFDIRHPAEFKHFHLPSARHIDMNMFLREEFNPYQWKGKKIYVICSAGERSKAVVTLLRKHGIDAYSIRGGIIEWSRLNLPRWRPNICKK